MKEVELPRGIDVDGTTVGFHQIEEVFEATPYGETLSSKVRYERYKPHDITNKEWENLLGADVNNLRHMILTYGLMRQFIRYNENPPESYNKSIPQDALFTMREKEDLLLTAIVHDWGEAVVGDISYDLKKESDEEEELHVIQEILRGMYGREESQTLHDRISSVLTDVLPNRTSKLGKAFNAVERIGYLRTSLRAWKVSKKLPDNDPLKQNLRWLTSNVLQNQIVPLTELATIYPAVETYLQENGKEIVEVFTQMPDTIFDLYGESEKDRNSSLFYKARDSHLRLSLT